MEKIRVFIGNYNDCYVVTYTNGRVTVQGEPINGKGRDVFDVLFDSLISVINKFKDIDLSFYCDNDFFAFEWKNEFKEGKLAKSDKHYSKWLAINDLCNKNKINLTIKGESDVLSIVGKLKYKYEN